VPTPPSHSARNHSKRWLRGRWLGLISVNGSRFPG
jgi:hypothetical protein